MSDREINSKLYKNMSITIMEDIREEILNDIICPGEKISYQQLIDKYHSNILQVRSALRSLELEGLITADSDRAVYVSELSADKARQIFETRIILELGAIELSIPNLKAKDIKRAYEYINLLDKASSGKELSQYNTELHNLLYSGCNNEYLLKMIDKLHRFVERYMRLYLLERGHNELSQEYHNKIVAAAHSGNIDEAKSYLRQHMTLAMDQLVEALESK